MNLLWLILIVILVAAALGSGPWMYHGGWGYGYAPFGGLGGLVLLIIILWAIGILR